jgi:hypothetical protein
VADKPVKRKRSLQHLDVRKGAVKDGTYDRLLLQQQGHCALCPTRPVTRRLDVDHDHRTMVVRGLLCHKCNRALPSWITPEWLVNAAVYLRRT